MDSTLQAAPAFAQAGRFAGAPHAAQIPRSTLRRNDSVFLGWLCSNEQQIPRRFARSE
ncbi:MAG: hypothetical protein ACK5UX_06010 [Burkholderiales bacterium]